MYTSIAMAVPLAGSAVPPKRPKRVKIAISVVMSKNMNEMYLMTPFFAIRIDDYEPM